MKLIITPKEIQILMEVTYRHSLTMYNTAKDALKKEKHQPLLMAEFCQYYGIPLEQAEKKLKEDRK